MDLSRVITGPVVTEKAERLKASATKTYTFRVSNAATKVDIKNALRFLYNVTADSVRITKVQAKSRMLGNSSMMEKRHAGKKAIVTLNKDSKALDLTAFQNRS